MCEFQGANITIIIDCKAPNAKNFTLLCVIGKWGKTKIATLRRWESCEKFIQ